jgi:tetratricopeptide (TPR) repeat protein
MSAGNYERADELTRAGLAAARATNDTHAACELSAQLADATYRLGHRAAAAAEAEEALRFARAAHDKHSEGDALRVLAMTERDKGNLDGARMLLGRALAIMRQLSDNYCTSLSLALLGDVELRADRAGAARPAFTEALELQRMLGQWRLAVDSLWGVAAADVASGQAGRAAVLLAAEAALRVETDACLLVTSAERYAGAHDAVEQRVTNSVLWDARARGRSMSRDDAVAFALAAEETPADMAPSMPAPPGMNLIRREGEYWTVGFDGTTFRMKDSKGLRYLAALLRSPGRELHVLDLVRVALGDVAAVSVRAPGRDETAPAAFGDAGPLLDQQAKVAYRAKLGELEEDLAEATSWADTARAEKIRDEIDFLTTELTGSMGLGGRDRRASSAAERARVNVTRSVRSVVQRIRPHDSTLADHLDATVKTGMFCSYTPDPRRPPIWQP